MGGFPEFFKLSATPLTDTKNDCNCSTLTTLASPNAAVLSELSSGDILKVVVAPHKGLYATNERNEICGAILTSVTHVRKCIEKGNVYAAKIMVLNGAECQVLIQKSE